MGKITKITQRVPQETILPDGNYQGTWGGSIIVVHHDQKEYHLTTDEGVRGMGFRVVVSIKDGKGTFEDLKN